MTNRNIFHNKLKKICLSNTQRNQHKSQAEIKNSLCIRHVGQTKHKCRNHILDYIIQNFECEYKIKNIFS